MPYEPPEPRCWHYLLPGGWSVRAGKTDEDNDLLTFRASAGSDWWFHVKGVSGSHVVLRSCRGMEPDRGTLEGAAAIAAWHSKARNAGVVAVTCTRVRHVGKPRDASPGQVRCQAERVLKVRPGLPEDASSGDGDGGPGGGP
ncbi:MAG: DUF814 domain-containing protein [Lentisphaeria bacterium]|nr:DUF814 domain-containing protein [Lentisphaeria bacterium]